MNNKMDWEIAHEQHWYRVPVERAPRRWPPQWLAFYQTKVFGDEAHAVRYFGRVQRIDRVRRSELFADEAPSSKSDREYYRIQFGALQTLSRPIPSQRLRLIVFIPTTMSKLMTADEINDLFDESPLEDAVWAEMKRLQIRAERQYYVQCDREWFALDFALFCERGKLDVETDGDTWHTDPSRIPEDNCRNNALTEHGWQVLRFNGLQVREEMARYCIPSIVETVNRLGGVVQGPDPTPVYLPVDDGMVRQLRLLDERACYMTDRPEV